MKNDPRPNFKHVHSYTGGFQIIDSCICSASTLLETKENKIIYKVQNLSCENF